MNLFLQIIGWYCILAGIILGFALWLAPDEGKSDEWKLRRTIAWLNHIGFLATGAMILMH